MNEKYKPIENFPKYLVSNYGKVKNIKTGVILKGGSDKHKYKYYQLINKDGETKQ